MSRPSGLGLSTRAKDLRTKLLDVVVPEMEHPNSARVTTLGDAMHEVVRAHLADFGIDLDKPMWDHRSGDDGAGGIGIDLDGKQWSYSRPATQYRRFVGRWEIVS